MSIRQDDGTEKLTSLTQEAINLEGSLANARTSSDVQSVISKLSDILNRIPLGMAGTGAVQGVVKAALAAAEKRKSEEQAQEETALALMMQQVESSIFYTSVSKHMTPAEKDFYDHAFISGQKYEMYEWQDGKYVPAINADGSARTVDGANLKQAFADIKYHALSDKEQKETGAPPGAKSGVEQMKRLKASLIRMEGYKAGELMKKGAGEEECQHCHNRFRLALDGATKVQVRYERIESLRQEGNEEAATLESALLESDRKTLRIILQDGVINETLVTSQSRSQYTTQGQEVSHKDALRPTTISAMISSPAGDRSLS